MSMRYLNDSIASFEALLVPLVHGAALVKASKEALSQGRQQITAGLQDLASCKGEDRKEALMKVVKGFESCAEACVTITSCPALCIALPSLRISDVATRKRLVKAMTLTVGSWYAPAQDAAEFLLSVTDRCLAAAATVKSLDVNDKDLERKVSTEVESVGAITTHLTAD